jgi:hypothetical protein
MVHTCLLFFGAFKKSNEGKRETLIFGAENPALLRAK